MKQVFETKFTDEEALIKQLQALDSESIKRILKKAIKQ